MGWKKNSSKYFAKWEAIPQEQENLSKIVMGNILAVSWLIFFLSMENSITSQKEK